MLIPRPETEALVDLAKQYCTKDDVVLDLCSGSGCVGIAVAREIGCRVIAVEKSSEALVYLRENVKLNNVEDLVEIIQADILEEQLSIVNCQLSTILINPPYLSSAEMQLLQREVRHEPEMALFGGVKEAGLCPDPRRPLLRPESANGLEFFHKFCEVWKEQIRDAKLFAYELGGGKIDYVIKNIGG